MFTRQKHVGMTIDGYIALISLSVPNITGKNMNPHKRVRYAQEIGFHFYKIDRRVMPECFYRPSIVSLKLDSRQKHTGMTVIVTEIL